MVFITLSMLRRAGMEAGNACYLPSAGMIRFRFDGFAKLASQAQKATPR
jgi:hypothetical protein